MTDQQIYRTWERMGYASTCQLARELCLSPTRVRMAISAQLSMYKGRTPMGLKAEEIRTKMKAIAFQIRQIGISEGDHKESELLLVEMYRAEEAKLEILKLKNQV